MDKNLTVVAKDVLARIADSSVDEPPAGETAKLLATAISQLSEVLAMALRESAATRIESPAIEAAYQRTVRQFSALQSSLSEIGLAIADRDAFIEMLTRKGHTRENAFQHLAFMGKVDGLLPHLVGLMQYDATHQAQMDVANGFELSSGSMRLSRAYFGPPKTNSGEE